MDNENNVISDIAEEAAENVEEVKDAVADASEDAAEAAKETIEEKVEEVKEAAEEKVEEVKTATAKKTAEVKKAATKQPEIKKKSGVNKTTLVAIIVCAVVVLACLGFVGYKLGWFHVPAKASMTMDDYSTIEVYSSDIEVTDSTLDSYLSSMQTHYNTTETITEGTVEEGDKIHIVYTGYLDGEAFEGGATGDDGTDITVGSSGYIDGFDDGLIGVEIGETVDLNLTFPDEYSNNPDLAGKDVVFTCTVESKSVTNTPDLTDDFIKENSADYTDYYYGESTQIDTVDDYRAFVQEKLEKSYLESAMEDALVEKVHVKSFDEENYNTQITYYSTLISTYAQMYGMDADSFATYYGYDSADAYAIGSTETELTHTMMMEKLAADLGITHSQEEIDEELQKYMDAQNITDRTLEEFKEQNGATWMYTFENYNMNREPVLEALKDRVKVIEGAPETEAETEAEANETEAAETEAAENEAETETTN